MSAGSLVREFDIIFYGVTGFTGRKALTYFADRYGSSGETYKYAAAGRNLKEVEKVVAEIHDQSKAHGLAFKEIPTLQCDATATSVAQMAECCTILVNLAGPYSYSGEAVMQGCIAARTHYVDITGELTWIADMYQRYNTLAEYSDVLCIVSCGFDFVPFDVSLWMLANYCKKHDLVPEAYTETMKVDGPVVISTGTCRSIAAALWTGLSQLMRPTFMLTDAGAAGWGSVLHLFPRYDSGLHAWAYPQIMTLLAGRFERWSNEVQGHPWGRKMSIKVSEVASGIVEAFFRWLLWGVILAGMIILSLVPSSLISRSTGEGKKGVGHVRVRAQARDGNNRITAVSTFDWNDGEAYALTALTVVEGALAILDYSKDEKVKNATKGDVPRGIRPPSVLGANFVDRLCRSGVRMSADNPKQ